MFQFTRKKVEKLEGETRLDYEIRATRHILNPNTFETREINESDALSMEFGFGRRIPFGYYIYLIAKLMTLYTIKGYKTVFDKKPN